MEMHDHGHHSDVGKAKCVIVKCGQVKSISHSEELFLDFLLDHHGSDEFLDGCLYEADLLLLGCSIGTGSMHGDWSRMHW